jgi:hypothetical protein
MSFKVLKKLPNVVRDRFFRDLELSADLRRDLRFGTALFQEFEHPRSDKIQPVNLTVKDVENYGAIPGMCRAELFGQLHNDLMPLRLRQRFQAGRACQKESWEATKSINYSRTNSPLAKPALKRLIKTYGRPKRRAERSRFDSMGKEIGGLFQRRLHQWDKESDRTMATI